MSGFESIVGVNPWTALFTFCNMLITFGLLRKFLFKPVKKMIDDRQAEIDGMYADANRSKEEAAALQSEYELHLSRAKEDGDKIIRDATARAREREQEILSEASSDAAALRAKAEANIALERKQVLNDAKNEISDIAMEIASKVIGKEIDGAAHQALVEEFIEKIGESA